MALLASEAMGAERTGYYDGAYATVERGAVRRDSAGSVRRGHRPVLVADGGRVRDVRRPARDRRRIARARGRLRYGWAGALPGRPDRLSRHRRRPPRGGHHGSDRARRGARPRRPRSFRPGGRALAAALRRRDVRRARLHRCLEPPRRSRGRAPRVVPRRWARAQGSSSPIRSSSRGCSGATRSRRAATRWAMFVFTPPGVDEQLVRDAGFVDVRIEDATANMWEVPPALARRARAATVPSSTRSKGRRRTRRSSASSRSSRRSHGERRLSRIAIVARRP